MRLHSLPFRPLLLMALFTFTAPGGAPGRASAWPLDGAPVSTGPQSQSGPVIVQSLDTGALIIWTDTRNGNEDIFAQRVDSTGAALWSVDGVAVCAASGVQSNIAAVSTFGGGAAIVWEDQRSSGSIYAQVIDTDGLSLLPFNGMILKSGGLSIMPSIVSDGVFAIGVPFGYVGAWFDQNWLAIGVQHFDGTGGGIWSAAETRIPTFQSSTTSLVIARDGVGGLSTRKGVVAAYSRRNTTNDIMAVRVRGPNGAVAWGPVRICSAPSDQPHTTIVNVGGSNVVIGWDDKRSGDIDLYFQKVDSSGVVQWLAQGLPICRATGTQEDMKLVPDGAGGVYAAWTDYRSGGAKVYAHHLDGNGQRLWAFDGIPVCAADGDQSLPALVAAGNGVLITWRDGRAGGSNIYAQKLDSSGIPVWSPYGVPLCRTAPGPTGPAVASDAAYGGIVAWSDTRTGDNNVYAMRAWPPGLLDVPSPRPERLRLEFGSANPGRGDVHMRLYLPLAARVRIDILDTAGRRIRRLTEMGAIEAGTHEITWDGADASGMPAAPGVYLVRVSVGEDVVTARAVRLR